VSWLLRSLLIRDASDRGEGSAGVELTHGSTLN